MKPPRHVSASVLMKKDMHNFVPHDSAEIVGGLDPYTVEDQVHLLAGQQGDARRTFMEPVPNIGRDRREPRMHDDHEGRGLKGEGGLKMDEGGL